MGYRQIYIKEANKLSLKDNKLLIIKEYNEITIPLEDINFILLEDNKTIITSKLLSEISKYYISFIFCDEQHNPKTMTYAYNQHYKQLEILELQLSYNKDLNKLLWDSIIKQKIHNQVNCLKDTNNDEKTIFILENYIDEVIDADIRNREGLAAKIYFKSVFGLEFIRFEEDVINSSLNYGYTIITSAITRSLVLHGLITYLGIHHISKTNNFNLSCDLVETYRPIVDKYIFQNIDLIYPSLSSASRKGIINLLNEEVIINDKIYTVSASIDVLVESYINSMMKGENHILLPNMIIKYDK